MKVNVNGTELIYDDHGVGLPVIFLHAFPLNRTMWTDIVNALLPEQRYRLITVDWPGFGESPYSSSDPLSMESFADDIVGLIDQLEIQQAVLCGLSMGGYAAFAFWQKYPERVHALILADTRPGVDSNEAKANREVVARLVEEKGVAPLIDIQIPKVLSEETIQHKPDVVAHVRQIMTATSPAGVAAASRGMARRQDSTPLLSSITCPTLVIVGEKDVATPPEEVRKYANQIPGSQLVIIPQAGHLSNLEQPAAFFNAVRSFLTNL